MKPQTLSMVFQSYENTTLISKECSPLTHVLWSRHKIPNQSKCVCDTDIWQVRSLAEGAGVVQIDGGVKGKRKVVGALGLEACLKWWNRSMSQRQALMAREISWQTVLRSLVSVMKCKLGCVIACVVTDWLTDATSLHAYIAPKTKCWACMCIWVRQYVCSFAKEPMKHNIPSFVCNYRAGRWPQRHKGLTILLSLPWESGSLSRLATASHKLHRTF